MSFLDSSLKIQPLKMKAERQPPVNGNEICPGCGNKIDKRTIVDRVLGEKLCKCGHVLEEGLFADVQILLPPLEKNQLLAVTGP